jgi:hypothetical protein
VPIRCVVQRTQKLEAAACEVVFNCEQITVWSYPEQRLIHHQIHKYCHGEPFRAALTAGTQAMQQQRALAWLSDDRLNGPLPHDDEQWGATHWFQQTRAAGWKYWAMVLPERAVGKLNVKRLIELCRKRGIEAQTFLEPGSARDWLRSLLKA